MVEATQTVDVTTEGDGAVTGPDQPKKRKKNKVLSAWIAFVGRILAQVIGALATIALGVVFIQRYSHTDSAHSASTVYMRQSTAAERADGSSRGVALAVLPLQNFSGDPQQEHFADGMTDALITDLAQIDRLHVISRTSSMLYKDQHKPLVEIARELGVDLIVEGSVVRSGTRVRVTAQLIDARTDEHLWAPSYDRTLGDVLSVQSEIATEVAHAVNVALTSLLSTSGLLAQRQQS